MTPGDWIALVGAVATFFTSIAALREAFGAKREATASRMKVEACLQQLQMLSVTLNQRIDLLISQKVQTFVTTNVTTAVPVATTSSAEAPLQVVLPTPKEQTTLADLPAPSTVPPATQSTPEKC